MKGRFVMPNLTVSEKFQKNHVVGAALGAGVVGAGLGTATALIAKVNEDEFAKTAMNVIDKKAANFAGLKRGFLTAPKEGNVVAPMLDDAFRQLYKGKSVGEIVTSKMSKENIDAIAKLLKALRTSRLTKAEKLVFEKLRNGNFTPDDYVQASRIQEKLDNRLSKKINESTKSIYNNLFGADKKFVGKRDCQKIIAKLRKVDPEPIFQKYEAKIFDIVKTDTATDIVRKHIDAFSNLVNDFKTNIIKLAKSRRVIREALVCAGIAAGVSGVAALIFAPKKS